MSANQKNNINDLKLKISIVDIISHYIKLSKKGNNYIGLCPFHDDKHASLTVNESKKIYKCFSCNAAGDVFSFVKNYNNISYSQAIIKTCELANIDKNEVNSLASYINFNNENQVLYDINKDANKYFKMFLSNKENLNAREYLKQRNISNEIIDKFDIGFAPNHKTIIIDLLNNKNDIVKGAKGYSLKDIERAGISKLLDSADYISYFINRITFAIRDENDEIVGFSARAIDNNDTKYINTPTTNIFLKNNILYSMNKVIKKYDLDTIYILEGFMDVIALSKIGIENAVATMGVAFSKNHLYTLSKLEHLKNIILCFDNDEAGQSNIEKTADLLLKKYNVYIVKYLTNDKDVDELVNKDSDLALKTINNVISYQRFKIEKICANTNLQNIVSKNTSIEKIIEILKTYTNSINLLDDIKYVSNKFNIDETIIKESLNSYANKQRKYNSKINIKKYEINDLFLKPHHEKKWTSKINPTTLSEIEILKFSLTNKKYMDKFFNLCGRLINNDIKQMINIIQDYYYENPSKENIDINDLPIIFSNNKYLSYGNIVLNEIKTKNVKYFDQKVDQIIQTHMKNLKKLDQQKISEKIALDENYSDEYINMIKRMNK